MSCSTSFTTSFTDAFGSASFSRSAMKVRGSTGRSFTEPTMLASILFPRTSERLVARSTATRSMCGSQGFSRN